MDSRRMTCEVAVVGGGPGGIAAARAAAEAGRKTLLIDNAPALGGNIWRGAGGGGGGEQAARWYERLRRAKVEVLCQATVFNAAAAASAGQLHRLAIETPAGVTQVDAPVVILATGARELFLPFPGWSLPNVMGAGGLQAMVKQGLPIVGKRVVVAGSGPLLLAVAAGVRKAGGKVVAIAEQAARGAMLRLAGGLLVHHRGKLLQAIGLQLQLMGIPQWDGCWVSSARAGKDGTVKQVTFADGGNTWTKECDYLACGFGLIPSVELAVLLGCATENGCVTTNGFQESSVRGIFAVGETCGIGGIDTALAEGEYAGWAAGTGACWNQAAPGTYVKSRHRVITARRFARLLERAFALRPEVTKLASEQTIVCRCEDVTRGQLDAFADFRAAKLHTRCGMGACQGRICGGALQTLRGWEPPSVRPPILPVRVESLAAEHVPSARA